MKGPNPACPWDKVPPEDTMFVLVTGANSGIGFGICARLIDEYLTTRSLTSHLVIIPTTRSVKKSRETVDALRKHTREFADKSPALRNRGGPKYDPRDTTHRVHILSIQLDLCNLLSIRAAARQLISGTIQAFPNSNPDDEAHFDNLGEVRIPRLDSVIFNAGIGGWYGLKWGKLFHNMFTAGLINMTTWPTFKGGMTGLLVDPIHGSKGESSNPRIGEVFCANVFGHYVFARHLVPLLSRQPSSSTSLPPGRIIWESSVEGVWHNLSLDDFEGVKTEEAYESTKRLTDILALTSTLPSTRPYVQRYLGLPLPDSASSTTASSSDTATPTPPKIYLVHPGVVQTTLFPLTTLFWFAYKLLLLIVRWLGSPWHPITAYNGACAPVWVALQEQEWLDAAKAERVKWGSSTDVWGNCRVKKTEVDGWGWEGKVEDLGSAKGEERQKLSGRRPGAKDVTEARLVEFEELGVVCWKRMEELRERWEERAEAAEKAGVPARA
ncbi:hypothetical protein VTJ04DRAFT_6556 [Mycothermus thermophilus]|uniref:uncharacterized protein n=1 Tax=Humicola insolens TaxID=85995 RepID=UPI0037427C72